MYYYAWPSLLELKNKHDRRVKMTEDLNSNDVLLAWMVFLMGLFSIQKVKQSIKLFPD